MTFEDSPVIFGLMALIDVPAEYRIEIKLLTASKENRGRGKQYEGIAGCLMAYAAKEAVEKIQKVSLCFLKAKNGIKAALHQ